MTNFGKICFSFLSPIVIIFNLCGPPFPLNGQFIFVWSTLWLIQAWLLMIPHLKARSTPASPVSSIPPDPHDERLAESKDEAFGEIFSLLAWR
jgi:hypothetical protein